MIIPYEIGHCYINNFDNDVCKISGITIKADKTIKIRLTPVPNRGGVFEVKEEDFKRDFSEIMQEGDV